MRGVLLNLLFRLLRALRPRRTAPSSTVLLLQYAMPLGCCVHGTPLIRALRRQDPDRRLIVATRGTGASVLRHHPDVDLLLETADPLGSLRAMVGVVRHLRRSLKNGNRPGLVLVDASSRSGRYSLLAAALRLAPTAGFDGLPALYDHAFAYDKGVSLIDNSLRLTALSGPLAQHHEPAVLFSRAELDRARELLREANPEHRPSVAFVMQGSGGQRTSWQDNRFAQLIEHVSGLGCLPIFLGTAADAAVIARIQSTLPGTQPGVSLAGRTSIPELAALLCLCDLLVSVDTGTMHLGRASQVPLVVLAPSWQKAVEWLPLEVGNARVLRGPDRDEVPPAYRLDEISFEDARDAVDDLLRRFPPSATARESRVAQRLAARWESGDSTARPDSRDG